MLILDPPRRNIFPRHEIIAAFIFEMKEMLNRNAEPRDGDRIVVIDDDAPQDSWCERTLIPSSSRSRSSRVTVIGGRIERRNGAVGNEGQDRARLSTYLCYVCLIGPGRVLWYTAAEPQKYVIQGSRRSRCVCVCARARASNR